MIHTYLAIKKWQFYLLLLIFTWLGLSPDPGEVFTSSPDLLLHFSGYVVAGISIGLAKPKLKVWFMFGVLLSYSFAIEVLQHFIPHRGFELLDLLANASGIAVGLVLYQWLAKPLDQFFCRFIAPNQTS